MNKAFLFNVACCCLILSLAAGCRKKPKGLTQIPGSEGPIVAAGSPAGLMDSYGNDFSGSNLSGGDTLGDGARLGGGGDFPAGSEINYTDDGGSGLNSSALPDRNLTAGKSEDRETLAAYTVYFDFDRYSIPSTELSKVEAVADFLSAEASSFVKIEGHCDERGTEEYNRALGERRALAVREVLVRLGVSANRVSTESWGEDMPAVEGENEQAYSKNRRGEFVILR